MILCAYRCTAGAEPIEAFFPLGKAPDTVPCEEHNSPARRQLSRGEFLTVPGGYADSSRDYRK